MTLTYSELLQSPNWKAKTIAILRRDNYSCQRCGTNSQAPLETNKFKANFTRFLKFDLLPESNSDCRKIRMQVSPNNPGIPIKTSIPVEELNERRDLSLIINLVLSDKIKYPFNGTTGVNNSDLRINKMVDQDPIFSLIRKKFLPANTDIDLEGLYVDSSKNISEQVYAKDHSALHVHHKCYRKGFEIWGHPDEEYVTLCNVCHGIVHENQDIPFYDIYGREMKNLIKCGRCAGKGYLKEYHYVQNGVCFKCHGRGKIDFSGD